MGSLSSPSEQRVLNYFALIMLYPLLKWDTSFPAGFSGETVDMLFKEASCRTQRSKFQEASSRTLRSKTEAPTRNFRHHEILESELDSLQPRTWIAERQRIDDSRRARGVSVVNKIGKQTRPKYRIQLIKTWISG